MPICAFDRVGEGCLREFQNSVRIGFRRCGLLMEYVLYGAVLGKVM